MTATQTKPRGNPRAFIEGTVTATDETIALAGFLTHGSIGIQLSGTWTGTITFEATIQGTTWVTVGLFPVATPAASVATTATANGMWGNVLNGARAFRCRFSTASSGTPVISINYLPSTW